MEKIYRSVGLVDDHTIFRKGLISFLNQSESIRIVMEASNGVELQEIISKKPPPDLLLLDISMPFMDGFETTDWLQKNYPALPVIILTMHDTDLTMHRLVRAGVRCFLQKECCEKELIKAILRVLEDGYYFNDTASRKVLSYMFKEENKQFGAKPMLSEKEWVFMKLAATDKTHKQIAVEMNISTRAVNKISSRLFERLGVCSRTVLAMEAARNGMLNKSGVFNN